MAWTPSGCWSWLVLAGRRRSDCGGGSRRCSTAPYEELWIGTWEALGERLLREHSTAAGLDPFFDVLGPAERLAMLLDRLDELPLRSHEIRGNPAGLLARLLERIDALKAGAVEPDEPELAELSPPTTASSPSCRRLDRGDVFLLLNSCCSSAPTSARDRLSLRSS